MPDKIRHLSYRAALFKLKIHWFCIPHIATIHTVQITAIYPYDSRQSDFLYCGICGHTGMVCTVRRWLAPPAVIHVNSTRAPHSELPSLARSHQALVVSYFYTVPSSYSTYRALKLSGRQYSSIMSRIPSLPGAQKAQISEFSYRREYCGPV